MDGAANFRGHVLKREEKGAFGIPLMRWITAGIGGVTVMTITKIPFGELGVVLGFIAGIVMLLMTSPHGGLPRWQRMLLDWRWKLRVALVTAPESLLGQVGAALQIPGLAVDINGDEIFKPEGEAAPPRTQLTDWVSFNHPRAAAKGDGLIFSKKPTLKLGSR